MNEHTPSGTNYGVQVGTPGGCGFVSAGYAPTVGVFSQQIQTSSFVLPAPTMQPYTFSGNFALQPPLDPGLLPEPSSAMNGPFKFYVNPPVMPKASPVVATQVAKQVWTQEEDRAQRKGRASMRASGLETESPAKLTSAPKTKKGCC